MEVKMRKMVSIGIILLSVVIFCCFCPLQTKAADLGFGKIISTGYAEVLLYPPHNEYDPNTGIEFKDRVVARYGLEVYAEIKHKDYPLFLFVHPFVLFGDSRPQLDYNYKADPIVIQIKHGLGVELTEDLDVRITHSEWKDLGGYKGERLVWNSLSLRYKW